jgi:hypothetical protein
MKTYDVKVTRDGEFWFLTIPEVDGYTQARASDEIEPMARDYIATKLDVDAGSFKVSIDLPGGS